MADVLMASNSINHARAKKHPQKPDTSRLCTRDPILFFFKLYSFQMGIDNDAVLCIGIVLSEDDIDTLNEKLASLDVECDIRNAVIEEDECKEFEKMFPTLFLSSASPYFDSAWDDHMIFVSIVEPGDSAPYDLPQDLTEWYRFLAYIGHEPIKPEIIALPDIH